MEVIEFAGGGECLAIDLLDVLVHPAIDAVDDLFHLLGGAFHDQFDSAVGEIPDIAEHVMAHGDVLDGVAETHALNSAGEMTLKALDGRSVRLAPISEHERELSKAGAIGQLKN
jgi:hypothetical protein